MAKQPSDFEDNENPGNEGIDAWEARFFSAEGQETRRNSQADAVPPGTVKLAAHTPGIDKDPVLDKRVSKQATNAARKHADDLGEALYDKFMQILQGKVAEKDGQLTPQDIEAMGQAFRNELEQIETIFLEAVETFTIAREKNRIEQSRGNLFQRLMVNNFEQRFADENTVNKRPELLSRRMLPGFSSVLLMMFGKQKLAAYERRVSDLIDELRLEGGGHVDWGDVYKSPKARRICLRAEVEIALYFKDIDKRFQWMIAVVNSNLIPPPHDYAT